jgi:asparaginyl-tRNA synthetase
MGPYIANKNGTISYIGNKLFPPIDNIKLIKFSVKDIENRVDQIASDEMWWHIAKINHQINISTHEYFHKIGAVFVLLPLTTRMISSPGALYGKKVINYTTDTCPISLRWFNLSKKVFLSESSQIYLELILVQKNLKSVYSVYNSFRKEPSDITHLAEFHHIEYEGKVTQQENEKIALGLIQKILLDLLKKNKKDLSFFLNKKRIEDLAYLAKNIHKVPRLTFAEVLKILYKETGNKKYKNFTLKHFGFWEEVKITEIMRNMVIIKEFPLLEVPFYHARVDNKNIPVADNADFIWPGYREIIGSGHRVRSIKELKEKAKIFNLPKKDYSPYLRSRKFKHYQETSGFGFGWERFLHGLLEMPTIWHTAYFPRVDKTIKP